MNALVAPCKGHGIESVSVPADNKTSAAKHMADVSMADPLLVTAQRSIR